MKDLKTRVPLIKGHHKHGLYILPQPSTIPSAIHATSTNLPWHHILGHPSDRILHQFPFIKQIKQKDQQPCISCNIVKSHKLPFTTSSISSTKPLELLYTDVWGPSPTKSINNYVYYLIIVDHFTKYIWFYPMKNKSDVSIIFPAFKNLVEKYFNLPIITLYSDNGGEFIKLKKFLTTHGISHQTTPPHTPELNSTAERRHRHIVETGKALLHTANLPSSFWSYAFRTAVYLINRLPTPILHMKSPFEVLHKTQYNPQHLHSFGCLCFPWLKPYTSNKLQPRSQPCIFIGYADTQYAYHCLDPTTNKIYTSRHVKFYDHIFPYNTYHKPNNLSSNPPVTMQQPLHSIISIPNLGQPPNIIQNTTSPSTKTTSSTELSITPTLSIPSQTINNQTNPSPVTNDEVPSTSSSPSGNNQNISPLVQIPLQTNPLVVPVPPCRVVTRSQNNIFKPKKLFQVTKYPLLENVEPSNVKEAMKYEHWRKAIYEEFEALIRNGTWSIVPPPKDTNIVGCKWLFRIKRQADGSLARYKARLVAKGFTQRHGVDFHETFAPVVRPQTIKIILSLALGHKWQMHQLDVNNAFLQGSLREQVYMAQPPGLKDSQHPHYVCKLHKAIYGLCQAPRAWHDALKSFTVSYGFSCSKSDPSLFIYANEGTLAYFLVYVDDLLLTGNNNSFMQEFISSLAQQFSLKNMGAPHYFLGIEIIPTTSGILLSQHKHIRDILERFDMEGAKPSPTPLSATATLQLHDGTPATNATEYRSILGALQYLNLTRPDISFSINKLAQFMHKPTTLHLQHLKRILRYLKNTINHGILLQPTSTHNLTAYSDADWGENTDDRTSTSAYIIFLGSNPISWLSKKQRTVARSSTEAEYRAVATAASEVMWIRNLLSEIRVHQRNPPKILCDNVGATYLCANPVLHSRMKHISMDYHFVREQVQANQLHVSHVSTKDQLADILTKPLPTTKFNDLSSKIRVTNGNFILRGHIRG